MLKGGKLLSFLFSMLFCVGVKTGPITQPRLAVVNSSTIWHGLHVAMDTFAGLGLAPTFAVLFANRALKKLFGPKKED